MTDVSIERGDRWLDYRLRADLHVEALSGQSAGEERYRITTPAADERFDFGAEELCLLHALAECRSLEGVCDLFRRRFPHHQPPAPADLEAFYAEVLANGLIVHRDAQTGAAPTDDWAEAFHRHWPASLPRASQPADAGAAPQAPPEQPQSRAQPQPPEIPAPPAPPRQAPAPTWDLSALQHTWPQPPGDAGTDAPFSLTPESLGETAGARPPRRGAWRPALGWGLFAAALIIVLVLPYPLEVGGTAVVLPQSSIGVRARFSGEVVAVHVAEGQRVTAGQLLAQIDGWAQRHAIRISEADLERKQAELALLRQGPTPEAIAHAREQLAMARVQAQHSEEQAAMLKDGLADGSVSALKYAQAQEQAAVDRAAVAVADANLALVARQPQEIEIAALRAEVRAIEERLAQQRTQLARTRIVAPADGQIATANLAQTLGQFLAEGDLFATIQDNRTARVEVQVPEADIQCVMPGARLELRVWSLPERRFDGVVATVAPVVEQSADDALRQIVRVSSDIDNTRGLLKTDMTGFAKIRCGQTRVGYAFGRSLLRFFSIEVWSWIP